MNVLDAAEVPTEKARHQLVVLPDGTQPVPLGSGHVTRMLGEGGAAMVYEIWNEQLGVPRAVKLLRPNAMADWVERFKMEMRITAQLKHPHIIEIHSVGEWNGLPYIEMEKLDGQSLDKIIKAQGALPVEVCLAIGIMVCKSLRYTHGHDYVMNGEHYKGILHRDLKPANIMISGSGMVKLMDFGLATPTDVSLHTVQGMVVGTMQYLAPEQLQGAKATAQTDLFAFGASLYEMLTGRQSFPETNMAKLVSDRVKNSYVPLNHYSVAIPRRLRRLVDRCLALDPARRARNAGEVLHTLDAILRQRTSAQPEEIVEYFLRSTAEKKVARFKHRVPVARLVSAAAVLAVIALAFLWGPTLRRVEWPLPFVKISASPSAPVAAPAAPAAAVQAPVESRQTPAPPGPSAARTRALLRAPAANRGAQNPDLALPVMPGAASAKKQSPLGELKAAYGTNDLMVVLAQETARGKYLSALAVYDSLTPSIARGTEAMIYKLRALKGLGDAGRIFAFLNGPTPDDAEVHLARVQLLCNSRRFFEGLGEVDRARSAPAALADKKEIEQDALYYRALCRTGLFDATPTPENRQSASEAWFDVKFAFRNNQGHQYYHEANEQIRRMADLAKAGGK